ncbi:hypothetical protein RYX36_027727 [Vicia faba]
MEIERDCKAVADIAVSKFKRVISLLEKIRTGHARFRKSAALKLWVLESAVLLLAAVIVPRKGARMNL